MSIIKSVDMDLARIVEADYVTIPLDDVVLDAATANIQTGEQLAEPLAKVRHEQGRLTGHMEALGFNLRREAELRDGLEKLERMIAEAPRAARRRQEELSVRARDSRLNASVEQDKRYRNDAKSTSRRRPLRKERREGRLLFLVLVIAIAVVVIWLMSHLHF